MASSDFGCMLSVGAIHFKDRFCASGIEGGGWVHPEVPCTWQPPWLAKEKPWLAVAGPFLVLLAQTGSGITPLILQISELFSHLQCALKRVTFAS